MMKALVCDKLSYVSEVVQLTRCMFRVTRTSFEQWSTINGAVMHAYVQKKKSDAMHY